MYVQNNMEARSFNHCCYVKAIGNTYSECGFVALDIEHAMRMNVAFPCSTIFFLTIS